MELPPYLFPSIYVHNSGNKARRDHFLEYGCHLNVDVDVDDSEVSTSGQIHCVSQKHNKEQDRNLHHLIAEHPTLPLSVKPFDVPYPFEDLIAKQVHTMRNMAEIFSTRVANNQGRLQNNSSSQFNINIVNFGWELSEVDTDVITCHLPPRLAVMYREYVKLQDQARYICVNSHYTGGCMNSVEISGDSHLLHLAGPHLDTLDLVKVEDDRADFLRETTVSSLPLGEPGYEVKSSENDGSAYICTRLGSGFSMCVVRRHGRLKLIHKQDMTDNTPSSVSLSPFIAGEVLVATETGNVFLHTQDLSVRERVLSGVAPRFHVVDPWRQCHWAAHPRQIILADRSAVQLYDIRGRRGDGLDVLAQPCRLLHQGERMMVTQPHPANHYCHFIATDFTLVMTDIRMPNHPVMLWPHTLPGAPQYLSVAPINTDHTSDTIVLVASQTPPDTHAYHLHNSDGHPPRCATQPWRLTPFSDLTWMKEGVADQTLLEQRMGSALAGVAAVWKEERLHTYQLSSHGEVFYQLYKPGPLHAPKVCSFQPGGQAMLPEAIEKARAWVDQLQDMFDQQGPVRDMYEKHNFTEYLTESMEDCAPPLPHVLCPLCMPSTASLTPHAMDPQTVENDGEGPREEESSCQRCGHTLAQARHIRHSHTQSQAKMSKSSSEHHALFAECVPAIDDLCLTSSNTRLLCQLWNQADDVTDLVKDRATEREKRQTERQEERRTRKRERRRERLRDRPLSVIDSILVDSQPNILEDIERVSEEEDILRMRMEDEDILDSSGEDMGQGEELTDGKRETDLEKELEKVCISPTGDDKKLNVSCNHGNTPHLRRQNSEDLFMSDTESQVVVDTSPGFTSIVPHTPSSPPLSPQAEGEHVDQGDDDDDDDEFFSQEVFDSLDMFRSGSQSSTTSVKLKLSSGSQSSTTSVKLKLSSGSQSSTSSVKLKLSSRSETHAHTAASPLKKLKTTAGF